MKLQSRPSHGALRYAQAVAAAPLLQDCGSHPCCTLVCPALCAARTDSALQELGIKSVSDLAKWKFAAWAHALTTLAAYERLDSGSR